MELERGKLGSMDWQTRIVADPAILVGKPTVKGTRISVELVIGKLAGGWTHEQILEGYPSVQEEDIRACLAYASHVLQEQQQRLMSVPA